MSPVSRQRVYASFWVTGGLASLIVVGLTPESADVTNVSTMAADVMWGAAPQILDLSFLYAVCRICSHALTVAAHAETLAGSQVRFSRTISPN